MPLLLVGSLLLPFVTVAAVAVAAVAVAVAVVADVVVVAVAVADVVVVVVVALCEAEGTIHAGFSKKNIQSTANREKQRGGKR